MIEPDSEIRKNYINALQIVEKQIAECELPLETEGCEVFDATGTYKANKGNRYWIALFAVSDEKSEIDKVRDYLREKFQ